MPFLQRFYICGIICHISFTYTHIKHIYGSQCHIYVMRGSKRVKGILKSSVLLTFFLISFLLIAFIDLKILFHD